MHNITLTTEQLHEMVIILTDRMEDLKYEIKTKPFHIAEICRSQLERSRDLMEVINDQLIIAAQEWEKQYS